MSMTEMPTMNFRNINLFLISLNSIIFILSLTEVLRVKNPNNLMWGSFINIIVCLIAWLFDLGAYYFSENTKNYRIGRITIFSVVILITSFVIIISLSS